MDAGGFRDIERIVERITDNHSASSHYLVAATPRFVQLTRSCNNYDVGTGARHTRQKHIMKTQPRVAQQRPGLEAGGLGGEPRDRSERQN